jgi:hypothetical protein
MSKIYAYVNEAGIVLRYQLDVNRSEQQWKRLYADLHFQPDETMYSISRLSWIDVAPDGTQIRVFHFTQNTLKEVDEKIEVLKEHGITVVDYRDNLK